jgi:hypothetical protein
VMATSERAFLSDCDLDDKLRDDARSWVCSVTLC